MDVKNESININRGTADGDMSSITIRELETDNLEEKKAVVNLVNRCYRGSGNWTTEIDIVSGARIALPRLEQYIADDEKVFVAVHDGPRIVGCVRTCLTGETVCGPIPNLGKDEVVGYFGLFAVHPGFGSRGLGNRLLATAENWCKAQSMTQMYIDVLSVRSDIIAWYNRHGYIRVAGQQVLANSILKNTPEERALVDDCYFIVFRKCLK